MDEQKRNRIALLAAFGLGVVVALAVGSWNPTHYDADAVTPPVIGLTRQQILDTLSTDYHFQVVDQKPNLYAVTLGKSGVTLALVGSADAPVRATVTAVYNRDTAQHLAVSARLLAAAILGDAECYGRWVGKATDKVKPGFDIIGTHQTKDSGVVEVRMIKSELDGEPVLSIAFRRLR